MTICNTTDNVYVKAFKIYVIAFIGNIIVFDITQVISIRVSVLILKIICWQDERKMYKLLI